MPKPTKNLIGQKFSRLTVINRDILNINGTYWICECDCGTIKSVAARHLLSNKTHSCGCFRNEKNIIAKTTHGMSKSPVYAIWNKIKNRCLNKKYFEFHLYGGRGITICDQWRNDFVAFYNYIGPRPSRFHSCDRINNDIGYFPGNVKWSTAKEQANNRRSNVMLTYDGRTMNATQWALELNIKAKTIMDRHHKGWTDEECLSTTLKVNQFC